MHRLVVTPEGREGAAVSDDFILAFGEDGRELRIPRAHWAAEILPDAFERAWNRPEELYTVIIGAMDDEFFAEAEGPARRLYEMDPDRERAALTLSTVYLELGETDDAERILQEYIANHGPTGAILTNMARVAAERDDDVRALELLLAALQVDPNHDGALMWWGAVHLEISGEEGFCRAMQQAADIPGSWRPQLWVARCKIESGDLDGALVLYRKILERDPVPRDALFQMSGDLGSNGRPDLVVEMVAPLYMPEPANARTGLNLALAYLQTGAIMDAADLLTELRALHRHDLREKLEELEAELAEQLYKHKPWWHFW